MPLLRIAQALEEPVGQDGLRVGPVTVKKIFKRRAGEKPSQKGGTYWYSFEDMVITDDTGEMTVTLNGCAPAGFLGIHEGDSITIEAGPDKNGKLVGVIRQSDTFGDPPKTTHKILVKGHAKIALHQSDMPDTVIGKLWLVEECERAGYDLRPAEPKAAPMPNPKTLQDLQQTGQVRPGSTLKAPQVSYAQADPADARKARIQQAVDDFFEVERLFMGAAGLIDEESKLQMTAPEAILRHPELKDYISMALGGISNRASR